jgi:hypothetical protein
MVSPPFLPAPSSCFRTDMTLTLLTDISCRRLVILIALSF